MVDLKITSGSGPNYTNIVIIGILGIIVLAMYTYPWYGPYLKSYIQKKFTKKPKESEKDE